MSVSPEQRQSGFCFGFTPHALWSYAAMHSALCAMREVETNMPAIASLEDLKAAQKEGLSIYAILYGCLP